MKKLLKNIFALVLALLVLVPLSLSVFADVSAPFIVPYDVIVNPGGTVSREGIEIPEGEVLTIRFEYEEDDTLWGFTEYGGNQQVHVKLSDVTNGDVIPEGTVYEGANETHFQVYAADGVKVYAGPGYAYRYLFTIPYGERVTGKNYMGSWLYVRYGDEGGWVLTHEIADVSGFVYYLEPDDHVEIRTVAEAELYAEPSNLQRTGTVVGTVPAGEKLNPELYSFGCYYVTYEGQSGWMQRDGVAVNEREHIFQAKEDGTVFLYNNPSDYNNGLTEPVGTFDFKKDEYYVSSFISDIGPLMWVYIEADGVSGWTPVFEKGSSKYNIADYPYSSDIIEYVTMSISDYRDMLAAQEYESHLADVQDDGADETKAPEKDVLPPEPDTSDDKAPDDKVTDDKTPDGEAPTESFFSSPTAIITFCVISAVVLALVAAVVLTIIKKKKKI